MRHLAPVRDSDRLDVATNQIRATTPRPPPPCQLRPPATALPLSVGRPFAFAWNESYDTAVLPFASQINCIPPAKANNCSFKMEVIFCVQGAATPPCGVPRLLCLPPVSRRLPSPSRSSTGALSHSLISHSTCRSTTRRATVLRRSECGMLSKYFDKSASTTSV